MSEHNLAQLVSINYCFAASSFAAPPVVRGMEAHPAKLEAVMVRCLYTPKLRLSFNVDTPESQFK